MPRLRGPWRRGPRLETRDQEILKWIARHGVVTVEQVARKFFARPDAKAAYSEWAAKNRIAALSNLGLIVRNPNPYPTRKGGGQQLLRVSPQGARQAAVGLAPAPLVISQLHHTLMLVSLTEFLLEHYPGAELTTEREIWAREYRRRYHKGEARRLPRIPDAILTIPRPDRDASGGGDVITVAVELDLSRKDKAAMHSMIKRYRLSVFDKVWWYVTEGRVAAVRAFVQELRVEHRFEVLPVRWQG